MSRLPSSPSLEQLRNQAKDLLKAHRAGDQEAVSRLVRHLPKLAGQSLEPASGEPVKLSEAQFVLAREYGFPSWPKLKRYIESVTGPTPPRCRAYVKELAWYEDRVNGLASAHQAGLAVALSRIRKLHPRFHGASNETIRSAEFTSDDARLVYAREHGFDTWNSFLHHLRGLESGETVEPFLQAFEAIQAADLAALERLLRLDPSLINARGSNSNTLLNLATSTGRIALCRHLLEAGSDVNLGNDRGWTPVHAAAYGNRLELLDLFLERGGSLEAEAHGEGGTPLLMALFWGHREAAERLARARIVPLNLRVAAGLGRLDLIRRFFDAEGRLTADAGARRDFYRPHSGFPVWHPTGERQEILDEALVYAAKSGRNEAIEELLRCGARIDSEPYNGAALHWAAGQGKSETVRRLVELGAPIDQQTRYGGVTGVAPLQVAAWGGRLDAARVLLELGANVGVRDPEYHGLAYGWANYHGHPEVAEYLLEEGSKRNLIYAAIADQPDRVRTLLEQDPSAVNRYDGYRTPLAEAAARGHARIVALLLEQGADPTVRDGDGKTPLELAETGGHAEVQGLLHGR